MNFAWPVALLALLLIPAFVALYLQLVRRRIARREQLAQQGFRPTQSAEKLRKRSHVPFAFFMVGLSVLLFSLARPQTTIKVPKRSGTVVLAFDISNSMRADDLKPSRMEAAKVAAKKFVQKQPSTIKIGVVAFSEGALTTQQPTTDRSEIVAAIDRLEASGTTSIGKGLFTSLGVISGKPLVAPDPNNPAAAPKDGEGGLDLKIGYFNSAAIVLLTDGEDRSSLDPIEVAKAASVAGIKIYPIGIGTPEGTVVKIDGFQVSTALKEEPLKQIASITNAKYYSAADTQSLSSVYSALDLAWKTESRKTEITAILAAISGALMVLGSTLSLLWFGRVV